MELPKSVKIGCFTYQLNMVDRVEPDQALKGQCRHYDKVIRVDRTSQPCDIREVIIHEITHAIDVFMELDMAEVDVSRLASAFAMVMVDNRQLFRLLLTEDGELSGAVTQTPLHPTP